MKRILALFLLLFAGVAARAQDANSPILQLLLMGNGLHQNDWGTQTNTNLSKLETAISGRTNYAVGGGTYTLSDDDARPLYHVVSGSLSSDETLVFPAYRRLYIIVNNATLNGHTVYARVGAGPTLVIQPASTALRFQLNDGSQFYEIGTEAVAIAAAQTTANAALPKAGGTMTGDIVLAGGPVVGLSATSKTYVDAAIATGTAALVPTGAIMPFYLGACPTGWIAANGTASTPDLRGEFVRGLDSGRGVDTGRTLASAQVQMLEDHVHHFDFGLNAQAVGSAERVQNYAGSSVFYLTGPPSSGSHGTETRPRNVALLYCMKT